MKQGMLIVLAVVLGGCGMTSTVKMQDGLLIQEVGQSNLFRPSMSVMQVSRCQAEEGVTTVVDIDGNSKTCYGRFVPVATVQGTQSGSMSGVFGAAIQGGTIVGGAYLLADGIRDGGSKTTNNNSTSSNGGNSFNSNKNEPYSISNAGASATGGAGGMGGSVNTGMPMRGRD